jgi:hypothetical protein
LLIIKIIIPVIYPLIIRYFLFPGKSLFEYNRAEENNKSNRRLSGLVKIEINIKNKKAHILFFIRRNNEANTIRADNPLGLASPAAFNKKGLIEIKPEIRNDSVMFLKYFFSQINIRRETNKYETDEMMTGAFTTLKPVLYSKYIKPIYSGRIL